MTVQNRDESITGADCSGTDGATGRAYMLAYNGLIVNTLVIHVAGAYLYRNTDYTLSGRTITFTVPVFDNQAIDLRYDTLVGTSATTSAPRYASTLQLAKLLGIEKKIPVIVAGTVPAKETVLTGTGSVQTAYLAQRNILASSYAFYTGGATEATSTMLLTESTHYFLDLTTGALTLTAAGAALISTNKVFASYSYLDPGYNFDDDYLSSVLLRAEQRVDNMVQTTFNDGEAQNPTYPLVTRESQYSKGWFDRNYFTYNGPIKDVTSSLASDITSSATTFTVTSGDGDLFPVSGYVLLESEVIAYSGISTDTFTITERGAFNTTAAAHASGTIMHTTIFEASNTNEGQAATFKVLAYNTEMQIDPDVRKIQVYQNAAIAPDYIASNLHRFSDVADRVRITYFYGYDTIPQDIERLTLLLAKQQLERDTVGKSVIAGRGEFSLWNVLDADKAEISDIVANYKQLLIQNV